MEWGRLGGSGQGGLRETELASPGELGLDPEALGADQVLGTKGATARDAEEPIVLRAQASGERGPQSHKHMRYLRG